MTHLNTYKNRVSFCAKYLWNNIKLELKNRPSTEVFKKDLKTHLFETSI